MARTDSPTPPAKPAGNKDGEFDAWRFERVLDVELDEIAKSRTYRYRHLKAFFKRENLGIDEVGHPDRSQLMGLSLSGGGIRSATFNLGVLQALADLNLLHKFDYLSTVSGGGYIGSWLAAWIKRDGIRKVIGGLSPRRAGKLGAIPGLAPEAEPIRFLRKYSNYLTPEVGVFSADTWALIATYLRNLLLNQSILILAIAGILLLPRVVASIADTLMKPLINHFPISSLLATGAFLTFSAVQIALNMRSFAGWRVQKDPRRASQRAVMTQIGVPLLAGAWLAVCWIWFMDSNPLKQDRAAVLLGDNAGPWWWVATSATAYVIPWAVGWTVARTRKAKREFADCPIAAILPGAMGGFLLWRLALILQSWTGERGLVHAMSWGPPLLLLIVLLVAVLHIGLMGVRFMEAGREWWSRLGGHLLALGLAWISLFAVSFYAPLALMALGVWVGGKYAGGILGGGWIICTLVGILGGKSARSGGKNSKRWLELVIQAAPYVFVAGALLIVSVGLYFTLAHFSGAKDEAVLVWDYISHGKPRAAQSAQEEWKAVYSDASLKIGYATTTSSDRPPLGALHWRVVQETQRWPLLGLALGIAVLGAAGLAWRVDINEFSMHLFYRNRLARCYLGASNAKRDPQPFTGFDPGDDEYLCNFSAFLSNWYQPHADVKKGRIYAGPYPLINTALNLVKTDELAWQKRKATSFVFSPGFCGYQATLDSNDREMRIKEAPAYRVAKRYAYFDTGGPFLGTAVAISGATASPNMGYHSTPALAFLMTVFNVRLGWWMGNPRHSQCWKRPGPKWGLGYLLAELTANTNDARGYVYLSDGGHFENLGIYELVRRRCRYIVACDGSADPKMTFEDLGNAIEKCRTDFGVDIEIDIAQLRLDQNSRHTQWHCAVGRIHYGKINPCFRDPDQSCEPFAGILVYLKSSLTGDEPADVQHYAAVHHEFPHESTADQFFDESQFESYRALGHHVATCAFAAAGESRDLLRKRSEELFVRLRQHWTPPSKAVGRSSPRHTSALNRIYKTLRCDPNLAYLDEQIYPAWKAMIQDEQVPKPGIWLPDVKKIGYLEKVRAGFYLCNEVIRLMEDLYTDLKLEEEHEHPDNRGWMNLFRHWSWTGIFRLTYAISASTYGARFQLFCQRRLGLDVGTVEVVSPMPEIKGILAGAYEPAQAAREAGQAPLPAPPGPAELNFLEWRLVWDFAQRNPLPPLYSDYEVFPFRIKVMNPADEEIFRSYTFGFCIVRSRRSDPEQQRKEICYFRVQDHLRDMGLAREALRRLLQKPEFKRAAFVALQMPVAAGIQAMQEDQEEFERLFNSVQHELG